MVEKVSKSLIGYEVLLNPQMSAMFIDPLNNLTLSYFEKGIDRIKITDKINVINIMKSIHAGTLRVMKDNKDVSAEFGGPKQDDNWHFTPIVEASKLQNFNEKDKPLLRMLERNDLRKIVADVNNITDYGILNRLYELEKAGKNPTCTSRAMVIEALEAAMEKTPGMSEVKEVPNSKKETISVK